MKILQISDTHNQHRQLTDLPAADVIVHCGDFTDNGTEEEVLNFLNWFIELPYPHKIFITGNHDLRLWEAEGIDGIKFFGLAYNHPETLIPNDVDVLITHEPPIMILDESAGIHWGNALLRNKIYEVKPHYHLFGHAHEGYGTFKDEHIIFSNGAILDDNYNSCHKPKLIIYK